MMRLLHLLRRRGRISADGIDAAIASGAAREQCAVFLDGFQAEAYRKLAARYKDGVFAKLLALKLSNLAATRYHYSNHHSAIFSHPLLLMVDPANACQLGCPSCVHSTNEAFRSMFDWPRDTLPFDTYRAFVEKFGPFAFGAALYNYGEPLLNKRFDDIVRVSKQYLLNTVASTNLSLPLDAEKIVASGLDYMVLSVDGATQPVYERYRRKGNLALVLENIRKLVAAKKTLGSPTPYLVWQFLTFEHNQHETSEAMRMAREIGVNEINVATPFAVDSDDPTIHPVKSPMEGPHVFHPPARNGARHSRPAFSEGVSAAIEAAFKQSWQERFHETGSEPAATENRTCSWLYFNMTMDGAGRVMPCCMAPDKSERKLVFSTFEASPALKPLSIVNSPMATLARESFASPESYRVKAGLRGHHELPYCARCQEKPSPPYGLHNVRNDLHLLDSERVIPWNLVERLTSWT